MTNLTCKNKRTSYRAGLLALTSICYAGAAFAQALPWQGQPPAAPYYGTPAPQYPAQNPPPLHHAGAPRPHPMNANTARSEDDRELDRLATKFYQISAEDPNAVEELKKLQHEVNDYRDDLPYHGYDASDIQKDAKKLAGRISHQRRKLEEKAAEANGAPVPPSGPAPQPHPPLAPAAPPPPAYEQPAAPDAPTGPAPQPHPPQAAAPTLSPVAPLPSSMPNVSTPPAEPR